jgi:hypothetical protein
MPMADETSRAREQSRARTGKATASDASADIPFANPQIGAKALHVYDNATLFNNLAAHAKKRRNSVRVPVAA